jgi:phage repressor protein C with HTH and peptisase S24 domain
VSKQTHPLTGKVYDEYVGAPGVTDLDAFAARVAGDSMRPKYRNGDIVIFSPATTARDGDDCYIRFTDGRTTFKRVYYRGDKVRLKPRNDEFTGRTLPLSEVAGIYRAVYVYRAVNRRKGNND